MPDPGPTVSVALCTYNGERFLDEQLDSILAGSRLPTEIVVVDDGSTDDTLGVIGRAASRIEARGVRLVVERNESPLGVTANFERAITMTTSQIVVLSDQDDVWEPQRLERALEVFADDPLVLLEHSDAALVDADGHDIGDRLFARLGVSERDLLALAGDDGFALLLRRNLVTGATVAFRRTLLAAAIPFPRDWVHDEWLAILATAVGRIRPERQPLVRYRQHGGNQIGVQRLRFRARAMRVIEEEHGRSAWLARRADQLVSRLEEVGASPSLIELARNKAAFERARSRLPGSRVSRLPGIARLLWSGGYGRFASRRHLDIARDLLQSR